MPTLGVGGRKVVGVRLSSDAQEVRYVDRTDQRQHSPGANADGGTKMKAEDIAACTEITDTVIRGFFGPYRWLSNFHLCPVEYEGDMYPSSENAFQAAKFPKEERAFFFSCTPEEAKKKGRTPLASAKLAEWEGRKVVVMARILDDKFFRNRELMQKLLDTGFRRLEETNCWDDQFWGVDLRNGGQNILGKLLMETREWVRKVDRLTKDRRRE